MKEDWNGIWGLIVIRYGKEWRIILSKILEGKTPPIINVPIVI